MSEVIRFWTDLENQCEGKGISRKALSDYKSRLMANLECDGQAGIAPTGKARACALELVTHDIEIEELEERLRLAQRRRDLVSRELWLYVEEQYGRTERRVLEFNPVSARFYYRSTPLDERTGSYIKSLVEYRLLVEKVLKSPVSAHRMTEDYQLPEWLRELAKTVVGGDLRPALRGVLDECLSSRERAKLWSGVAMRKDWPGWFRSVLKVLCVEDGNRCQ
ncbi:MAG: hypothetical protein ABW148_17755 [Sedimenticola sp.]